MRVARLSIILFHPVHDTKLHLPMGAAQNLNTALELRRTR
jgi:hypothetical protein